MTFLIGFSTVTSVETAVPSYVCELWGLDGDEYVAEIWGR